MTYTVSTKVGRDLALLPRLRNYHTTHRVVLRWVPLNGSAIGALEARYGLSDSFNSRVATQAVYIAVSDRVVARAFVVFELLLTPDEARRKAGARHDGHGNLKGPTQHGPC